MKCHLIKLFVFVIAGAILNVAVAWGCALLINPYYGKESKVFTHTHKELCVAIKHSTKGAVGVYCGRSPAWYSPSFDKSLEQRDESALAEQNALIPTWTGLSRLAAPVSRNDVKETYVHVVCWGWPLVCLFAKFDFVNVNTFGSVECAILLRKRNLDSHDYPSYCWSLMPVVLPTAPLQTAFMINSIFYAAILWLLFAGPFALRRFIRRRRGLCIRCGYDLRGQVAPSGQILCPECGQHA